MMRISRYLLLSVLLFSALFSVGEAFARGGLSLDQAVEDARRRGGGRVISAETQERDGQRVYNIRLLTKDGKVKRIRIDGDSGQRMQGRPRR
jgi:uncharacterized membrane protein YkoI